MFKRSETPHCMHPSQFSKLQKESLRNFFLTLKLSAHQIERPKHKILTLQKQEEIHQISGPKQADVHAS